MVDPITVNNISYYYIKSYRIWMPARGVKRIQDRTSTLTIQTECSASVKTLLQRRQSPNRMSHRNKTLDNPHALK